MGGRHWDTRTLEQAVLWEQSECRLDNDKSGPGLSMGPGSHEVSHKEELRGSGPMIVKMEEGVQRHLHPQ